MIGRKKGIKILKTTQGPWGSNACGDGKITESLCDSVPVIETRKVLTKIINKKPRGLPRGVSRVFFRKKRCYKNTMKILNVI